MKYIKKILFLSACALSSFGSISATIEETQEEFLYRVTNRVYPNADAVGLGVRYKIFKTLDILDKTEGETSRVLSIHLFLELGTIKNSIQLLIQELEKQIISPICHYPNEYCTEASKVALIDSFKNIIKSCESDIEFIEYLQRKYCPDLSALKD